MKTAMMSIMLIGVVLACGCASNGSFQALDLNNMEDEQIAALSEEYALVYENDDCAGQAERAELAAGMSDEAPRSVWQYAGAIIDALGNFRLQFFSLRWSDD